MRRQTPITKFTQSNAARGLAAASILTILEHVLVWLAGLPGSSLSDSLTLTFNPHRLPHNYLDCPTSTSTTCTRRHNRAPATAGLSLESRGVKWALASLRQSAVGEVGICSLSALPAATCMALKRDLHSTGSRL
jgi:hypothetical protein